MAGDILDGHNCLRGSYGHLVGRGPLVPNTLRAEDGS